MTVISRNGIEFSPYFIKTHCNVLSAHRAAITNAGFQMPCAVPCLYLHTAIICAANKRLRWKACSESSSAPLKFYSIAWALLSLQLGLLRARLAWRRLTVSETGQGMTRSDGLSICPPLKSTAAAEARSVTAADHLYGFSCRRQNLSKCGNPRRRPSRWRQPCILARAAARRGTRQAVADAGRYKINGLDD